MRKCLFCSSFFVFLAVAGAAPAWWVKGHESIAQAAAARLPEAVPAFLRAGGKHLAHCSGDPDRWKNPDAPHLRAAEAPDHYIDLEDYAGKELPADRYQAAALLVRLKQRPDRTGMLPYAIMENYDRLCCAFYDYRTEPNNETVRMKCLVYAGSLAHFTGDAVMPLHTTRDYDGKRSLDGTIVQHGIHAKIDAFPEKNGLTPEEIARGLEPRLIEDMWAYVLARVQESHRQVARCYDLDAATAFEKPTAESRAFILERCRAGAQFTLDLWYNAWLRSAKMRPPY
jgi:hypothetical protein